MGYVHDSQIAFHIPPTACHFVTGTWSDVAAAVTDTIGKRKTAGDETATLNIPVFPPFSKAENKGFYLTSVDIWFDVATADLEALSAVVNLVTMGADGAAPTVAAQTFTYDAGHDAADERVDQDEHKITLTLATPIWMDDGEQVLVELTIDAAATSLFTLRGAQANGTLRL